MSFNLEMIDGEIRHYMKEEYELDISNSTLYISKRLTQEGAALYPQLLLQAIENYSPEWLASQISEKQLLKSHEERRTKSGSTLAKIPYNAHEMLSEGEFNRFYIRGLCRKAINESKLIQIVRGKEVSNPRSESVQKIGLTLEPGKLLNDLRENTGVDTAFGLPPGPNSGLTGKIV